MGKLLRIGLCLTLAVCSILCSCALDEKKTVDMSRTVISIGEEKASLAVFKALFDKYLPYMQTGGQDPLNDKSSLESFQDWILDSISMDMVIRHQAKLAGFKLNDEQEKELSDQTQEEIDELYDRLMEYAEKSFADDQNVTVETYFDGLVNSEAEYCTGIAMSWDDYKEYYRAKARDSYIVRKYKEAVCAEFEPTDDDVMKWYQSAHESDKDKYKEFPEKYKADEELYEQSFGRDDNAYPITYVPAGYARIMHIVINPNGELPSEYHTNKERMNELKAKFNELAFEDAVNSTHTHSERITEIIAEYNRLKDSTDNEFGKYVEDARNKAYMAFGELEHGKVFSDVMLKYTEDERVIGSGTAEGCKSFQTRGELISLEYKSLNDWSEGVKNEFKKLSVGEYSKVFFDNGAYHIIYYAADEASGDVPVDKLYDDIKIVCSKGVQDKQWEALVDEWKNDPELTVDYDSIRSVGIEDLKKHTGE